MKQLQNIFALTATFVLLTFLAASVSAENNQRPLTQGELAKRLVFISGLADDLPAPVTGENAARALNAQGWAPIEGWRVGAVATKEDFFVVMAKYLGLKVANPNDPQSYYNALAKSGFSLGQNSDTKALPKRLEERNKSISHLVLETKGDAEYRDSKTSAWKKLGKLQLVKEGMGFRTGNNSYLDVVYTKGSAQRIYENSELDVETLREDVVESQPAHTVVVQLVKGEAVSLVEPMNKASQFVMKDPFGKFEVDKASGCTFNANISDEQTITLNNSEQKLFGVHSLAVVESRRSASYTVARGVGSYNHPGANLPSVLGAGQSLKANFSQTPGGNVAGGANAGGNGNGNAAGPKSVGSVTVASGINVGSVINKIELAVEAISTQTASPLTAAPLPAESGFLTTSELTSFLTNTGGSDTTTTNVTPIQ